MSGTIYASRSARRPRWKALLSVIALLTGLTLALFAVGAGAFFWTAGAGLSR